MSFEVFISYSHKDDELRQQLDVHLASLKSQGKITAWHDRAVEAGQEWAEEIRTHLESARIILLLISPDFIASEHCYDQQMQHAMERHEAKTAIVIPIILRSVYWKNTPFSKLQVLPREGKAITLWSDLDEALVNVVEGIDKSLERLSKELEEQKFLHQDLKSSKPLHNLPQPDYGTFIGREKELRKIKEKLRPYPHSVHSVLTIDGIGGIGKSALALEASLTFLRNHDDLPSEERFEAIVWTSAKRTVLKADKGIVNRKQVVQTLGDICQTLAVVLRIENLYRSGQEEDKIKIIRRELTQKRTLLIIDNLETVDDIGVIEFIQDLLPAPTKAIVTTRHRIDVAFPIRLRGMLEYDAQLLIQQESNKKGIYLSEENQRKLYDRTGGVPLAIVWSIGQAGLGYPINLILKRLSSHSGDLTRFCFQAAVDQIRRKDAYKLLLSLALCGGSSKRDELGCVSGLAEDEWSRDDGLVELDKLSLINKEGEKFSLLPLTKEYVNSELEDAIEFVRDGVPRLIACNAFNDLELAIDYFEKYSDRLPNSSKLRVWNILNSASVKQSDDLSGSSKLKIADILNSIDIVLEEPEGLIPFDSIFYMERSPIEKDCYETVTQPGSLIRIHSPRQMGKTSLLVRILGYARQQGLQTVNLSCQTADNETLSNLDDFLQWFCISVTEYLDLKDRLADYWEGSLGILRRCHRYFERYILAELDQPLVLGLDELDQVIEHPKIATDFFRMLRTWHEAAKSHSIWQKLSLVIVHSTEVYVPLDINQSPFNAGSAIQLRDLNQEEIENLIACHKLLLSEHQKQQLINLVGGHPYLLRAALYQLARARISLSRLLDEAPTESGMYSDHLRRHILNLEANNDLLSAFKQVISANAPVQIGPVEAFQLNSMGLIRFEGNAVTPRYGLYKEYFQVRLGID